MKTDDPVPRREFLRFEQETVIADRSRRRAHAYAARCYVPSRGRRRPLRDDLRCRDRRRARRGPRALLQAHSSSPSSRWFFLYTIRISNEGETAVQLINRHWTIVDGTGHTEEVHGPGVVGEQPVLEPAAFEYTSGCPLPTPFGSMAGVFDMQRADGTGFEAEVALFQLMQPGSIH